MKETRVKLSLNIGTTEGNYLPTENPRRTTELCFRLLRRGECKTGVVYKIIARMDEGWVGLRNTCIYINFLISSVNNVHDT
jgi:hypothetical protein